MLIKIVEKIELQSVLVLLLTLSFGVFLLKEDNTLSSPAGILGSVSIVIGLLYTFGSFFSNQIKESYKDVIIEYKSIIDTLKSTLEATLKLKEEYNDIIATMKSSNKAIQKSYQEKMNYDEEKNNKKEKTVGDYKASSDTEIGTSDE